MRIYILLFLAIFLIGCGGAAENSNAPVNAKPTNANVAAANTNGSLETNRTPTAATTNNAPTLAPVVLRYYEALKGKDEAALRKVYSQATVKSLEADMKDENKKSLVEFITELEPVPDKPLETRNERIEGDTAIAEIRGGSYPNGIEIKFVKEGGEWKMTNESPVLNAVKQSAANSNSSK